MRNINIVSDVSQKRAEHIFGLLRKYTSKNNECLLPYMGGNLLDKSKGFLVGLEIESHNPIKENYLWFHNIIKKYMILGKILK